MICAYCPDCRLRFNTAAAVQLHACPECGRTPQTASSLEAVVGFALREVVPTPAESAAAAAHLPVPDPGAGGE